MSTKLNGYRVGMQNAKKETYYVEFHGQIVKKDIKGIRKACEILEEIAKNGGVMLCNTHC